MALRRVRIINEVRNYSKTALLSGVMPNDRYRIGREWHLVADTPIDPPRAIEVDGVVHFQRHAVDVGDTLIIESFYGEELTRGVVTNIVLTHKDLLTPADVRALGMESHDDVWSGWAQTLASGPIWLTRFYHVVAADDFPQV
jgi:hypothetical protein